MPEDTQENVPATETVEETAPAVAETTLEAAPAEETVPSNDEPVTESNGG